MTAYSEYLAKYENYRNATNDMCRAAVYTLESRKAFDIARYGVETVPAICRLAKTLKNMYETPWNDSYTHDAAATLIELVEYNFNDLHSGDDPLTLFGEVVADLAHERLVICRAFARVAPLMSDEERERLETKFDRDCKALLYVLEYIAL